MLINLPEHLAAFFAESGYLQTTPNENRSNARLRVRCEADLYISYTPIALANSSSLHSSNSGIALVKDLSRTGVGLIYHEQLFPQEQLEVYFQQRVIYTTVVRCRKLGDACYEIGGIVNAVQTIHEEDGQESE